MSDEIKGILNILKNCKDYDDEVFLIKQHSATLLLDYITNLQQNYDRIYNENCKLREKHNITDISLLDENYKLEQYNKQLEENNQNMQEEMARVWTENERLKETNVYCNRTDCSGRLKDSRKYDSVYQEKEDYKSRVEKAIELLKNKKEEYKNMTDYHQYYVEGYDKSIELTHSSHSGIMLETIKSTTIKNCDDLLNILQNGSDKNE